LVSTLVGAMRLFFGSLVSSRSLSLASLLTPAALPVALLGVSGGVVTGTPVTLPELVAVRPGTLPPIRVGLFTTVEGTVDDCVAMEDVELDRAGEWGRCELNELVVGGGEGAAKELIEPRFGCCVPAAKGEGGANWVVGVGVELL
jgi:hypothetical protein